MSLLFECPASWLSVPVHDQMAQFVGNIEALTVVIALRRVEYDHWPEPAVEGEGVNRGRLRRAEDDQDTVVLKQTNKMSSRLGAHAPLLPDEPSRQLWTIAFPVVDGNWEGWQIETRKLDMPLQAGRDVDGELPIGERLVPSELTRRAKRPEVRGRADRCNVLRPHREEAGIDRQRESQLGNGGRGWPLRARLPGCYGCRALVEEARQVALPQTRQVTR